MKATLIFLILVISKICVFGHEGHEHDDELQGDPINSNVLVLTDENFDSTITENEFVFVEFYAPWCGHCKRLIPEYEALATHFKDTKVKIAKVDCIEEEQIATKFNIMGYPTLKFFKNGEPKDYDGGRTASDLITWLTKKTGPPSKHLSSKEELTEFLKNIGTKVVAYIEESGSAMKNWNRLVDSEGVDDFTFAHVTDSSLYGDYKQDTIVLYKGEEEPILFPSDQEIKKTHLLKWLESEGYPLVDELAQRIWDRSRKNKTPLIAVFLENIEGDQSLVEEIAKKFKGQALTAVSGTPSVAERWGASGKVFPTAIVVLWGEEESVKFVVFQEETQTLDLNTAEEFVTAALKGEYKSYKKSQPIPQKNDDPVTIVVGKNFEDVVFDETKDVFVEFYAPWCGHCIKLAPIWDELGETFDDVDSIVIAKTDVTANSYPDSIDIKGFPTLIFYPSSDKQGVPYDGERDLKSLTNFVKKHSSHFKDKEDL